jgi:hypothetical protein
MARETRAERTINRLKEEIEGNEREIKRLTRENRGLQGLLSDERRIHKEKLDKLKGVGVEEKRKSGEDRARLDLLEKYYVLVKGSDPTDLMTVREVNEYNRLVNKLRGDHG